MPKQLIDLGVTDNDGTGNTLKAGGTKINDNFDEVYAWTGWESKLDIVNTITLLAATNNLMTITGGVTAGNNGLTLMDSVGNITPIGLNDVINISFSCTFITPSGTDHYVNISLFVPASGFFRSFTKLLVKGAGNDDAFSIDWTVPVGATFLANGGTIILDPDVNVDYKDRYIAVTRIHKGQ